MIMIRIIYALFVNYLVMHVFTSNIDFDNYVNTVHNIWNYVYYLSHLHLSNPNNFNRVENSVWEKLEIQDYSWLPIDKRTDDNE